MDTIDIAFIGSGAASTSALIELLNLVIDGNNNKKPLNIAVIEKYNEFWKGIPYGGRSSVNSLIITPVTDFLPPSKESHLFFNWMEQNIDDIISNYTANGGETAHKWVAENQNAIDSKAWSAVYIPRFFFGLYLEQKMGSLLKTVSERQLAQITLMQAEVTDVDQATNAAHCIALRLPNGSKTTIMANKVVLAIGSPPVKQYADEFKNPSLSHINDVYYPSLQDNIAAIEKSLANIVEPHQRNILLIGANASSIELLYLLNGRSKMEQLVHKIVSISPSGCLPYHISDAKTANYPCQHLDDLKQTGSYDIQQLIAAAKHDLKCTVNNGAINVPYVEHVVSYTIELMQVLDEEQKKLFFGVYGMQLTRLIRRSGSAYKQAQEMLMQAKKLELLKGRFSSVTETETGALLHYIDGDSNQTITHPLPFAVVINCTGANQLENSSSQLIKNLIKKNICKVNLSGKAFEVNESFEASPQFYVYGPLLGGNMNKRIHFWHLENVARLLQLSPYIAEELLKPNLIAEPVIKLHNVQ